MDNLETGWTWFDRAGPDPDDGTAKELRRAFARCFGGAAGAQVLAHLREITQYRFYGPEAPDAALRHLEGQRHLVAYIGALIERGRNGG